MSATQRFAKHEALVNRMAETLGLDLAEAELAGKWPPEDMQATVARCTGCTNPEGCGRWLDAHAETRAEAAPGYCRNRDLLQNLRDALVPS